MARLWLLVVAAAVAAAAPTQLGVGGSGERVSAVLGELYRAHEKVWCFFAIILMFFGRG